MSEETIVVPRPDATLEPPKPKMKRQEKWRRANLVKVAEYMRSYRAKKKLLKV